MSTWAPVVLLASFIFGAAVSAINVPEMVIIQTSVDQDDQPQVYAVINASSNVFPPASPDCRIRRLAERFRPGACHLLAVGSAKSYQVSQSSCLQGLRKTILTADKQKSETVKINQKQ
ncbi:hypothetical protein ACEQPO_09170 [Bacillus sp. SL00103]